jgi:acyl-CoA synthetase (AMP-forming)/AMP-acid ligase II/thioesterase domain-containing protein
MISTWANQSPNCIAVMGLGRVPLTYSGLYDHIKNTVGALNEIGICRNDRVALVLPNGPDMATAFLAVACGATCAPLNPGYQSKEFEFYLSDLRAKALMIQSGIDSPAISIAKKKEMDVIRISPVSKAGVFTITNVRNKHLTSSEFAQPEDVALVLHTSGTTARPKMVPLTHYNICTSASNTREALGLKSNDCCLNIMPLFHIHGLIGATLSTISCGASIVCTPGFHASEFFQWVKDFCPTWYTAVPTMHQAILERSKEEENRKIVKHCKLRFVRSCSSALLPSVMVELEKTFNVPVIESYGMTEAAHQIASNPLPPRKRKQGSVGIASGTEITIMDDKGKLLSRGEIGEIVVRGPSITKGYENNPEANTKAFVNSWFKTGDQGYFDEDNYLIITDRIKEIINRGGEKISPREIDEVLLSHPSILQAVTFAVPHSKLGEDIAAAVVLRDNIPATEWEIQKFLASRLADFKVPHRIVILDEIPKGSTGKIQRIGLAQKLGLTSLEDSSKVDYEAPGNPLEKRLAEIWSDVLRINHIGVNDNFFQLGGDSIQARLITFKMCEALEIERIPLVIFLHAPTIKKMAHILSKKDFSISPPSLTAIQSAGSKPPFYCVHACEGEVLFLADLARNLGSDQPFYGLRAQGLDSDTPPHKRVEEMATHYLNEIQAFQPEAPYFLGGAGVGGVIALEMAHQLMSHAKNVAILALMDTVVPRPFRSDSNSPGIFQDFRYYLARMRFCIRERELFRTSKKFFMTQYSRVIRRFPGISNYSVWEQIQKAVDAYTPPTYTGRTILFLPEKREGFPDNPRIRMDPWRRYFIGPFDTRIVPGEHLGIFEEPSVQFLARQLKRYLDEVRCWKNGKI